ncbi:hypothetical protein EAY19_25945, partial [Vibrio anguillarum]
MSWLESSINDEGQVFPFASISLSIENVDIQGQALGLINTYWGNSKLATSVQSVLDLCLRGISRTGNLRTLLIASLIPDHFQEVLL